jgi:tetratricopeptide (TPR) repeat protein
MVSQFFSSHFQAPKNINECSFYERLYIYQAYVWYYHIIQDFVMCYKYSQKWVDLFRENPGMIYNQTDMYFKGINNLLVSLHMTRYHSRFKQELDKLLELPEKEDIPYNDNNLLLYNLFQYTHVINYHFLEGTFTEGVKIIPEINQFIEKNKRHLDNHRILIFYYKIASLYFGSGDYKNAIRYLNFILNYKDTTLREDIHSFSRILNLLSHFELGNDELIEYQVKSTYRFLSKMDNLQQVQRFILNFLRKLSDMDVSELKTEFQKLHDKLVSLEDNPFEKRAFLYLDLISWLESKIQDRPVQEIIQEKARKDKENSKHYI